MIQLSTNNGHNVETINEFNSIARQFSNDELLEIILGRWADDQEIECITEYLKDTLSEN